VISKKIIFLLAICVNSVLWAAEQVIIVSIDGGRPDVLFRAQTPNIQHLLKLCSFTFWAETTDPSITLVSHASMLTGVGPEKHKVIWNDYQPLKGVVTVDTVFKVAKQAKMSTAMIVGKEKFKHLIIENSVDSFSLKPDAKEVVTEALDLFTNKKLPNLTFLHFNDMDVIGHKYGWGSAEQLQAAANVDVAIGRLLNWIKGSPAWHSTDIIITADHGGHEKGHGDNIPSDKVIPWIACGQDIKKGYEIQKPVKTYDTSATALALLNIPVPAEWQGKALKEIMGN